MTPSLVGSNPAIPAKYRLNRIVMRFIFATRKLHELFQKNFIEYTYSTFFFSRISEDVKALEKIENLWRDALTAAVDNHAKMTSVKENTDTESSGGVKYSKAEKTL